MRMISTRLLLPALASGLGAAVVLAHGGGLDSQGGHHDRKQGTYHFHRGPLAGNTYSSKSEGSAALQAYSESSSNESAKSQSSSANETTEPDVNVGSDASYWNFLSADQQRSCGLQKLSADERAELFNLFMAFASSSDIDRSTRAYVENEVGLTSEIVVRRVSGDFLILDSGHVLEMWDAYDFESGGTYLANDGHSPDQVLDHEGKLHDVTGTYWDMEEALEDQ
jgi:hypothetical protein